MATLFSRIISGEIPCYKVAEDNRFFAFLDIHPLARGHVLVVPRVETDYLFDLDDDMLSGMILFAKKVAVAIKQEIPCNRVGVAVIGLEIPHAHIHLVPVNGLGDLDFSNPKISLTPEEFSEIAIRISNAVSL
ncbi:MAG: HIT family protein [Bacteroidales bacterium]